MGSTHCHNMMLINMLHTLFCRVYTLKPFSQRINKLTTRERENRKQRLPAAAEGHGSVTDGTTVFGSASTEAEHVHCSS